MALTESTVEDAALTWFGEQRDEDVHRSSGEGSLRRASEWMKAADSDVRRFYIWGHHRSD